MSQAGEIDLGLSDHELILCTQKISRPKPQKHNEILVRPLKHYTKHYRNIEKNPLLQNAAYSHSINTFMKAIYSAAPIKKVGVKANSKPWSDAKISAIQKLDKLLLDTKSQA